MTDQINRMKMIAETYKKMLSVKNLKELILHYGNQDELEKGFYEGLNFVPDKLKYIKNRIAMWENNIKIRKTGIEIIKGQNIQIESFGLIGFEWVNNGHNASAKDLRSIWQSTSLSDPAISQEARTQFYVAVLNEVAIGGSLAFHIAFLNKQMELQLADPSNSINSSFKEMKVEFPTLSINDHIWLKAVYEISKTNKRPDFFDLKAALSSKLPRSYNPSEIPRSLINSDGEEITLLGAMVVGVDHEIGKKCNQLIASLQDYLLSNGNRQNIMTTEIAKMASVDPDEAAFLLHLISYSVRIFARAGTSTGFYGIKDFEVSQIGYKNIMNLESVEDIFRSTENLEEVEEPSNKPTTATQVLAIHFLLKNAGISPVDNPTAVTRFIQFLSGRELNAKKLQSTTIYKSVIKPFKLNEKSMLKDLRIVRRYFQELGLDDIVHQIDKEIESSSQN